MNTEYDPVTFAPSKTLKCPFIQGDISSSECQPQTIGYMLSLCKQFQVGRNKFQQQIVMDFSFPSKGSYSYWSLFSYAVSIYVILILSYWEEISLTWF